MKCQNIIKCRKSNLTAKQSAESVTADERKIDQLMHELRKKHIDLAGAHARDQVGQNCIYKVGTSVMFS